MFRVNAGTKWFLAMSAGVSMLSAASPSIGVAISNGSIRIDDSKTAGNASVFNGSVLDTDRTTEVRMNQGGTLQFGTSSSAKLFSDHIDLRQGSAKFSGLSANANGLRILPDSNASANVSLAGKVVMVAALTGNVRVFNAEGMTVANLLPGRALNLTPQDAGASAPSSLIGCATKSGDVYTLTDETSNVTVQLRGGNVKAGKRIQVTGTTVSNATAAGGATQVITVTSVKTLGGACKAGGANAAAGAGAAGATAGVAAGAAAAGVTSTAVVAGVAAAGVAATAGAVAAANINGPSNGSSSSGNGNCVGVSPCTF